MYLTLVQLAESFGVSEAVVTDWIQKEGLPHTPDRGRLLFDKAQVAEWAVQRGLAAKVGFLATENPAVAPGWRLEELLRAGGIWRDVKPEDAGPIFARVIAQLPGATPAIRQLLAQRMRAAKGVTFAPIGNGFALPHLSTHISLGRGSGAVALILLTEPLSTGSEVAPDEVPVTRLLFFVAPSPRAHLDVLGRLCRLLSRGHLRDVIARGASDDEIFREVATADPAPHPTAPAS